MQWTEGVEGSYLWAELFAESFPYRFSMFGTLCCKDYSMVKIVALRALRPLCGDDGILFAVLTITTALGRMMKQLSNSVVVAVVVRVTFFLSFRHLVFQSRMLLNALTFHKGLADYTFHNLPTVKHHVFMSISNETTGFVLNLRRRN